MDGDQAPLVELVELCQQFGAFLIVDEAHAGGIYGDQGQGLVSQLNLDFGVFAKIITFGKAFGSHGACVLGSADLKSYLINFSRPFIYTTAIPPTTQARILGIVRHAQADTESRANLFKNIQFFKSLLTEYKLPFVESNSAIQGILIPGNDKVKERANQLIEKGFLVKPILSPTVEKGKERLRICLHSFNTEHEITSLIHALL
jgi:8-amino-7-oxononanoate synthase